MVSLINKPNLQSSRLRQLSLRRVEPFNNQQSFQSYNDKSTILPQIGEETNKCRSIYIIDAQKRVKDSEISLANDPRAHIKIDGGYGDYCMGIFRVKDRQRWLRDIPTLFTSQSRSTIISCFPNNTMDEKLLQQIISRPQNLQKQSIVDEVVKNNTVIIRSNSRKSKLFGAEEHMNNNIISRHLSEQHKRIIGQRRFSVKHTLSNPFHTISPISKRQTKTTKMKPKGYMFKGLAKLHRT